MSAVSHAIPLVMPKQAWSGCRIFAVIGTLFVVVFGVMVWGAAFRKPETTSATAADVAADAAAADDADTRALASGEDSSPRANSSSAADDVDTRVPASGEDSSPRAISTFSAAPTLKGAAPLKLDVTKVKNVPGDDGISTDWGDSYSVGKRCYCDTNFDHNIGEVEVVTKRGKMTVKEACNLVGPGPGAKGRPVYNTVQCGWGPASDSGDENRCPGRIEYGKEGCGHIGPKWDIQGKS